MDGEDPHRRTRERIQDLKAVRQAAQAVMRASREKWTRDHNERIVRKPAKTFKLGDRVMHLLRPGASEGQAQAWVPKWAGPYEVVKLIGPLVYYIREVFPPEDREAKEMQAHEDHLKHFYPPIEIVHEQIEMDEEEMDRAAPPEEVAAPAGEEQEEEMPPLEGESEDEFHFEPEEETPLLEEGDIAGEDEPDTGTDTEEESQPMPSPPSPPLPSVSAPRRPTTVARPRPVQAAVPDEPRPSTSRQDEEPLPSTSRQEEESPPASSQPDDPEPAPRSQFKTKPKGKRDYSQYFSHQHRRRAAEDSTRVLRTRKKADSI